MQEQSIRLLVVGNNTGDYMLLSDLLRASMPQTHFDLHHTATFEEAIQHLTEGFDLFFFDYRLGARTGIELLRETRERGLPVPVIMLITQGDEEVAAQALKAGAVDCLPRHRLSETSVRLAVRYALNLQAKESLLRRSRAALRASEERFRALVENGADLMTLADRHGTVLFTGRSVQRTLGYLPEELIGTRVFERVHPDDLEAAINTLDQCLADPGKVMYLELRHRHRDECWRVLEAAVCNRLDDPAVKAIVINGRDITERKQAEQELRASEERYRLLFERNLAGVFRASLDYELLECNSAFCQMLGYETKQEIYGRKLSDLSTDKRRCEGVFSALAEHGQVMNAELALRRRNGSVATVLMNAGLLLDHEGDPEGIEGTLLDVTETYKLREQLMQSQKMDAIGKLAGGVAHDFNNLLMIIISYSEMLFGSVIDPRQRRQAEQILTASRRAAELTRQLLAFSRKQVMAPGILDLNAVVSELGKMLPRLIGENILVQYALAPDLGKTRADPTQIQQVLMNLAVNARDAMPNGGRLCIETSNITMDTACAGSLVAGHYVMLAVSDTGAGIDPAVLPRIFEPFFTTKEHGKGTGLGLSMVYGIVQQSGGQVFVYSEPGRGSTFKVYLPRVQESEQVNAKAATPEAGIGGSETILLVEDEPELRAAAADFLRSNGYTIIEAHNGDEALAVASRTEGQIDLLLTDVIMPGMTSGPELARRVLKLRPGIHVLYMSGYTENIALQHGIVNLASQFLQKPFSLHLLGKKIREILDSKALPVTA